MDGKLELSRETGGDDKKWRASPLLSGSNCLIADQTDVVSISHPASSLSESVHNSPAVINGIINGIAKRLDSFQCVDFSFEGQSWKSRRKRPSGEACKYCLPCGYFSC